MVQCESTAQDDTSYEFSVACYACGGKDDPSYGFSDYPRYELCGTVNLLLKITKVMSLMWHTVNLLVKITQIMRLVS